MEEPAVPSAGEEGRHPENRCAACGNLKCCDRLGSQPGRFSEAHVTEYFNGNTHTQDLEKDAQGVFIHNTPNLGTAKYP